MNYEYYEIMIMICQIQMSWKRQKRKSPVPTVPTVLLWLWPIRFWTLNWPIIKFWSWKWPQTDLSGTQRFVPFQLSGLTTLRGRTCSSGNCCHRGRALKGSSGADLGPKSSKKCFRRHLHPPPACFWLTWTWNPILNKTESLSVTVNSLWHWHTLTEKSNQGLMRMPMQDHVTGFTSGKAFTVTVTAMVRIYQ